MIHVKESKAIYNRSNILITEIRQTYSVSKYFMILPSYRHVKEAFHQIWYVLSREGRIDLKEMEEYTSASPMSFHEFSLTNHRWPGCRYTYLSKSLMDSRVSTSNTISKCFSLVYTELQLVLIFFLFEMSKDSFLDSNSILLLLFRDIRRDFFLDISFIHLLLFHDVKRDFFHDSYLVHLLLFRDIRRDFFLDSNYSSSSFSTWLLGSSWMCGWKIEENNGGKVSSQ